MTLGIIGTAGRGGDKSLLTEDVFRQMVRKAQQVLDRLPAVDRLISGGAAWADHVAVHLFLTKQVEFLTLHLPAEWDYVNHKFVDNGLRGVSNPGGIANYYHQSWKHASLADIEHCLRVGGCSPTFSSDGLFARNNHVANDSDALLAFTFGHEREVRDGGTADTVRKYLQLRKGDNSLLFHCDLNTMLCYPKATVAAKRPRQVIAQR